MKVIGIILLILGLIGCVLFGIQAANDSETLSIFGADIAVSSAKWAPLIISAAVFIIGVFMVRSRKATTEIR